MRASERAELCASLDPLAWLWFRSEHNQLQTESLTFPNATQIRSLLSCKECEATVQIPQFAYEMPHHPALPIRNALSSDFVNITCILLMWSMIKPASLLASIDNISAPSNLCGESGDINIIVNIFSNAEKDVKWVLLEFSPFVERLRLLTFYFRPRTSHARHRSPLGSLFYIRFIGVRIHWNLHPFLTYVFAASVNACVSSLCSSLCLVRSLICKFTVINVVQIVQSRCSPPDFFIQILAERS